MRSGGVSGSSLPPPPGLGSPSQGGALRLEDLERKITQATSQPRMVCFIKRSRHLFLHSKSWLTVLFLICLCLIPTEYDI